MWLTLREFAKLWSLWGCLGETTLRNVDSHVLLEPKKMRAKTSLTTDQIEAMNKLVKFKTKLNAGVTGAHKPSGFDSELLEKMRDKAKNRANH
jgi:hypothetical protein